MRLPDLRIPCLLVLLAGLSACGTSQPTRYYLLSSSAPAPVAAQSELTLGIGPIILPPYLDRREMVSRSSDTELGVAVYHQWGEPLRDNISRVLREDLGRRLGTDRIIRLPVKRSLRRALVIDYQVTIVFGSFEKNPDGKVVLEARWAVLDNDKNELLLRRSEYSQNPTGADHAAQAAAQSRVLGLLGEEIAAAVLDLERAPGH